MPKGNITKPARAKKTSSSPTTRLMLPNGDWLDPTKIESVQSLSPNHGGCPQARLVIRWRQCEPLDAPTPTTYLGKTTVDKIHHALQAWAEAQKGTIQCPKP